MNKFLELITVPIGTNGQSRFELSGDYFEIIDSTYPVTVLLEDRNGAQIGRMSGAEASYFLRDTPYTAITIASAQAQTVRIAFGSGEAGNRRTAGVVQVVDGGRARTNARVAFMGGVTIAPGAANYAKVQLWNPLGTGKNVIVSRILGQVSGADGLNFYLRNSSIGGVVTTPLNKMAGGAASVAEIRRVGDPNLEPGAILLGCNLPNSGFLDHQFAEPLVLPPGWGIVSSGSTLNNAGGSSFEFFEETI